MEGKLPACNCLEVSLGIDPPWIKVNGNGRAEAEAGSLRVRLKSRRPTTMSAIQLELGVTKSRCRLIRNRRLSHGVGVNRPGTRSPSPGRLGDSLGASAGVDSADADSDSRSEADGVPPVSRESGGIERPAERGRPPPRLPEGNCQWPGPGRRGT